MRFKLFGNSKRTKNNKPKSLINSLVLIDKRLGINKINVEEFSGTKVLELLTKKSTEYLVSKEYTLTVEHTMDLSYLLYGLCRKCLMLELKEVHWEDAVHIPYLKMEEYSSIPPSTIEELSRNYQYICHSLAVTLCSLAEVHKVNPKAIRYNRIEIEEKGIYIYTLDGLLFSVPAYLAIPEEFIGCK